MVKSIGWYVTLLSIFTLAGLMLNVHWIVQDSTPTAYDDSWYLENAFRLYHRLTKDGLFSYLQAYLTTFRVKAPLIAVLPLPFFAMLGPSLDAALLINCVFLIVINVYLFRLGRRLFSPATGLLAVVVFQTMPITIGMSRAFMTEYGLVAFVVAFLYYLVESHHFRDRTAAIKLGVVAGLGLLMKINFLIVAGPLLAVIIARRRQEGLSGASWPLGLAAGMAGLIAGPWYAFNAPEMLSFISSVWLGQIENYQISNRLDWLSNAARVALSPYYSWGLLIIGSALLSSVRPALRPPSQRFVLLLSWFVPGALMAFYGAVQDYCYLLVILPPIALGLAETCRRVLRSLLPSKLLAPTLALLLVSPVLGFIALSEPTGWLSLFRRPIGWARLPGSHGAWGQQRIVEAVRRLAPQRPGPRNVVVGIEHPYLNSTLLNCINARHDGALQFHTLAFEPDPSSALARVRRLSPDVIVLPEGFPKTELEEFLNRSNESLRQSLVARELPYRRTGKVQLVSCHTCIVAMVQGRISSFKATTGGRPDEEVQSHARATGKRQLGGDHAKG